MTRIYAAFAFLGLLPQPALMHVRAQCRKGALPTAYVAEGQVLSA